jgi:hypothetical protein
MARKNREQRRREKFGHAGGATTEPWPQSQANPALGRGGSAEDADVAPAGGESPSIPDPDKAVNGPTKPAIVGRRKKA